MPAKISLLLLLLLLGSACSKTQSDNKKGLKDNDKAADPKDAKKESPKKPDPVKDKFNALLSEVKPMLAEAKTNYTKFLSAEKAGNEADRKKYIRLARAKYILVLETMDRLRVKPYVDDDEDWLEPYLEMKKIETAAGIAMVDITKRAHQGD